MAINLLFLLQFLSVLLICDKSICALFFLSPIYLYIYVQKFTYDMVYGVLIYFGIQINETQFKSMPLPFYMCRFPSADKFVSGLLAYIGTI